MNALALASRNLLRNRRRSVMTMTAMVLGLIATLLFGGYVKDINYGLQTDFVQITGHLQIQRKGYFRFGMGNPSAYSVAGYERVIAAVKQDPVLAQMTAVVTPTLQFGGIAGNFASGVSGAVYVSGVVVEDQNRMREWNDYRFPKKPQRLSLSSTSPDSVVIGTGVARVLQLCSALDLSDCSSDEPKQPSQGAALPDDIAALAGSGPLPVAVTQSQSRPRIEILAATARGAPNVAALRVLNAEFQGIKELDDIYVGMHLSQAQKLIFGAAPPQVTAILLQLHHTSQIPAAVARLEELLNTTLKDDALEVLDFETLNPFYGQAVSMFATIFGFIAILIGAIVLFTVTNTMGMAVVERTVEIGTLRAIGVRRSGIRAMFVIEGLVLGCIAALLGSTATLALAWAINHLGLTWVPPGRIETLPLAVRVAGEYGMIFASTVCLVLVAAFSSLLPATRASRMNIVEALRHV